MWRKLRNNENTLTRFKKVRGVAHGPLGCFFYLTFRYILNMDGNAYRFLLKLTFIIYFQKFAAKKKNLLS